MSEFHTRQCVNYATRGMHSGAKAQTERGVGNKETIVGKIKVWNYVNMN